MPAHKTRIAAAAALLAGALGLAAAIRSLPAAPGSQARPAQPGVRNGHAMAYDSARGRVVLFGGADQQRVMADLWRWDGDEWAQLASEGPPARTFPGLVYDEARDALVLVGGNRVLFGDPAVTDTMLGDTWVWKAGEWREVEVAGPGPRAEAAVVYDSHRQRVVLFGGYRRSPAGNIRLGDTWEWDGHQWALRAVDGPPARNGAAFAFDARRQRAVLFGGSGRAADTWEWDGSRWRERDAGVVPGRFNAVMMYASDLDRLVRFGGWTGTSRASDTWTLDHTGWTRLDAEGPEARNHSAFVYDERRGKGVLFGGHDGDRVFGDTWEWDGRGWRLVTSVPALRRVENGH